jgi:hypothetical protein
MKTRYVITFFQYEQMPQNRMRRRYRFKSDWTVDHKEMGSFGRMISWLDTQPIGQFIARNNISYFLDPVRTSSIIVEVDNETVMALLLFQDRDTRIIKETSSKLVKIKTIRSKDRYAV